ncbi:MULTISPECIES: helix-turn-helix transcriptional regulator [Pseudomonas]|uniref:helix-turn-helix transcriptional regulator n=1 Tax=Pseudomonas TaxID=286 RepID=UPI000462CFB2|nr:MULTISPECIES: AlpA family phage regulatory protein [Pseudomonas]MBC9744999.1 AlpA family phage regulatory protein [Pseudomonas syringae pv. syringae]MBC9749533.1 AlpA family phage regulatory protein [Pseudomonas syringae pv. syringae]MCA5965450.1 AlpA family phage regulatory protein [Pseudomonas sp. P129]MCK9723980.1 AlpA family phage regulatory protein [Pseudomonas syringae pv. syringae]RMS10774.1 Prophage CP4-57 regulatory, AlpA-like protein [Pseudomonas coronafaciens pv. coronafaciens]
MSFPLQAINTAHPARDPATTLIRISEVIAIVGLARPTIYKLMQQQDSGFPLPVKLSNSNARGAPVAWVLGEVQAWTRARIAARDQVAA